MKVLVCGSRNWPDPEIIRECLESLAVQHDGDVEVIHGDARGADRMGGGIAEELGLPVWKFPADWDRHGKRAGILRNLDMLDANPDAVLAFRVNGSRGTTHMIEAARKRGIPVEVYEP